MDNLNIQEKVSKKRKVIRIVSVVVSILILMFISFNSGMIISQKNAIFNKISLEQADFTGKVINKYSSKLNDKLSKDVDFKLFWDTWNLLENKYVDKSKINEKQMFYGALKGMVASLNDPYTVFMDPKISQEFSNDMAGTFEGIGAEIGIKNDVVTIISPLADMPAEKAGLKAGDKILAINGVSTSGMIIDQAVNKIRGTKGSTVKLSIYREGFKKAEDYTVTRDVIVVKSVRTEMKGNIYVVKITNFNDDTRDLFKAAAKDIITKNPKGLILDLRNNPGGYLDTAIDVASEWITQGVIVTEKFSEEKKNDYLTRGQARLANFPTVVLVNQGSASASEIVAGALKDYKKATLVGMKTYGKGSVQSLENLQDGSSLKITVAKWLTPKGVNINEQGIMPDVTVDLKPEAYDKNLDPQLDKAMEILNGKFMVKNN